MRRWMTSAAFVAVWLFGAPAPAQALDIGGNCTRWNELRLTFEKGSSALTTDAATALSQFVAGAGKDCGYRIYASASKEGDYARADQIAAKRKEAVLASLRSLPVDQRKILVLDHWVDDAASDSPSARAAVLYTFPNQGVACGGGVRMDPLDLWFEPQSTVISQARLDDMKRFVESAKQTDCNIEVSGSSTNEFRNVRNPKKANRDLAKARVKTVAAVLAELGFEKDRIVEGKKLYVGDKRPDHARLRNAIISLM